MSGGRSVCGYQTGYEDSEPRGMSAGRWMLCLGCAFTLSVTPVVLRPDVGCGCIFHICFIYQAMSSSFSMCISIDGTIVYIYSIDKVYYHM